MSYLTEISDLYSSGDATEPSYYPLLSKFLKNLIKIEFEKDLIIILLKNKVNP